ncbi:high affinity copper uptake protein 1-like [Glandiceps talaboti]
MNHNHNMMDMGPDETSTMPMAMDGGHQHGTHMPGMLMSTGMTHNPHAGHDTGNGMSMDHDMGMKMYFHFSESVTILFKEWQVDSVGALIGSCIAIFFLAVLYEGLKVMRESLLRKSIVNVKHSSMLIGKGSGDAVLMETHGHGRSRLLSLSHLLQTILHVIQIVISYFLMLIFMTYNVWLCIAVALGAGFGYFVFGWKKTVVVDINEHCH